MAADRAPDGGFGDAVRADRPWLRHRSRVRPRRPCPRRLHVLAAASTTPVQMRERLRAASGGRRNGGQSGRARRRERRAGPLSATDAAGTLFFAWHGTEFATLQDTIIAGAHPGPPPVPGALPAVGRARAGDRGRPGRGRRTRVEEHRRCQAAWWTGMTPASPAAPGTAVDLAAPNHTPGFQGGPARAGRIAGAGVTMPLEPAWTVDTGRSSQGALLAGGRVFLRGGGDDRPVIAYDLATGLSSGAARSSVTPSTTTSPTRTARLFVPGHETLALDAATGGELWRSPAAGEWPVVDGGRLVMAGNGSITACRPRRGAPVGATDGQPVRRRHHRARARVPRREQQRHRLRSPHGRTVWRQSAGTNGYTCSRRPSTAPGCGSWAAATRAL